ncbi:D-2-hydroxyacid dehydrogenase [Aliivibrio fischeri]|uniref:D-2-hydroxyacid dehydrogenase n=1 Tax=Aliivibrio fischeri TaxID=668 RepID=UPI0012DA1C5E|nr:D-2-hydroxyacid dehydrogenase [Aliivibrio fischeri]MUJ38338.1 D-2-hydroxyacid dehydrogenase [Aliivibrio fischeri]
MNKLLIISKEKEKYLSLLEQADLPDLEICHDIRKAEILLADPPLVIDLLDQFKNLKWLQSTFAGVDSLIQPNLRTDYHLTNVRGIFGQQISEYVLGYSIQYFRHFKQYAEQQKKKQWQPHTYSSLVNKCMVILGTGSIGSELAATVKQLGFIVYGINRSGIPPKDSPFDCIFHISEIENAFQYADVIVNTLPKTELTMDLLNSQTLKNCNGALLFNVGRGEVLENYGLLNALESGSISHVFLDVFAHEPLSQECPYWNHPNITITPHIAALSFPEQVFEQFYDNYLRWRDGFSLINSIDFTKGY